jgi:RNA polymerase sigma-70 factor (ECF subfamily)
MNEGPNSSLKSDSSLALPDAERLAVLKTLVEEMRPYLKGVAAAILDETVTVKVDPSDVVQQALLASFAGFDQFRGASVGDLRAWLIAIVRNAACQSARYWTQDRRDVGLEQPFAFGIGSLGLEANGSDPGEKAIRRERAGHLLAALDTLSPEEQQIVRLRNFADLKFGEIAQRLGCSETTARERWVAALERLKRAIPE